MSRSGRKRASSRLSVFPLLVSALAAVLSLGSVLRAYAMPVEARVTDPWYSYQSSVGFDFVAHVTKGKFYESADVRPADLISVKGPVEPPVYHRVLIAPLTNDLEIRIPYKYQADRSAPLHVKWQVDGTLILPGLWQKAYPLVQPKEFTVEGQEASGQESFVIPVRELMADLVANRTMGIMAEPLELHIHPVLSVSADGLREKVDVVNTPEFVISLRQQTVEVDDPRESKVEKNLAETRLVPITMQLLGWDVSVATVRQVSLTGLISFLVIGLVVLWAGRKKPDTRTMLQRLGANLITARAMELNGEVAMVEVPSAKELLQVQVQTDRPVIRVGNTYYLQDGVTCYRLVEGGEGRED